MELNELELKELKEVLNGISTHLPHDKTGYIWGTYNKVRDSREPQPCQCKSSGGLWLRAIEHLREYISNK